MSISNKKYEHQPYTCILILKKESFACQGHHRLLSFRGLSEYFNTKATKCKILIQAIELQLPDHVQVALHMRELYVLLQAASAEELPQIIAAKRMARLGARIADHPQR